MSPTIKVNPKVLPALRKHYGLSIADLALRSKVDVATIGAWESQEVEASVEELTKVARHLRRNWTVFLLDEIQLPDAIKHDNRSVGNQKTDTPHLETVLALERAERLLSFAPFIKPHPGLTLPDFKMSRNDDPENKGEEFRRLLKIKETDQLGLSGPYQAFNYWKDVVASLGIYIAEMPLANETIKAFSMMNEGEAIIVLSTKDTVHSRIFSLFHEVAHILLNQSNGVCDLHAGGNNTVETYCNYFAAAFLLSRDTLIRTLLAAGVAEGVRPPDSLVKKLSGMYEVSPLVVYRRLVSTGHITDEAYGVIHEEYMAQYWSFKDSQVQEKTTDSDYFPFYKIAVNSRGKKFVQDVFHANSEGKISYRDIGNILDVTQKQISKIKETAFNSGAG